MLVSVDLLTRGFLTPFVTGKKGKGLAKKQSNDIFFSVYVSLRPSDIRENKTKHNKFTGFYGPSFS